MMIISIMMDITEKYIATITFRYVSDIHSYICKHDDTDSFITPRGKSFCYTGDGVVKII